MKTRKSLFSLVLAVLLLFSSVSLSACSSKPSLSSVREEYIRLIEASADINDVLWGNGLPVYEADSEEARALALYEEENPPYLLVKEDSPYLSVSAIKAAAENVYSLSYLSGIYEQLFDGYTVDGIHYNYARYIEKDLGLYKSSQTEQIISEKRVYDYSTMKIVSPSRKNYVNVSVVSWLLSAPEDTLTVQLSFLYQNNRWYLDSPTY